MRLEFARRGLTPREFARKAKVGEGTVYAALKGVTLTPEAFGKILKGLGAIPYVDIPDDLLVSA